jgi:hydroxymethylglutaryl-CoA reductase (NADPH)
MREQWTETARLERLRVLRAETDVALAQLAAPLADPEQLRGQIENFVGVVRIPVGVAGPLVLRGKGATGSFYVPLATTEGTLVLAVTRGAAAISDSGGARVWATDPHVTRAPLFVFPSHEDASEAGRWAQRNFTTIRAEAEATTRHGKLVSVEPVLYGRRLVLEFTYSTGDAAGQNMVTFATDAACRWLRQRAPFSGAEFFTLESSLSHDKKIAALSQSRQRGRQVDADITIPRSVVTAVLKAEPEAIAQVAREGVHACVVSGAVGAQAQFANILAALFVATGQDVASVVECGTGLTVMEVTPGGDLYASVTIPNLIIGSVGGGTRLPSQRDCLDLLGCAGRDCARKLAEIAGAAVLAGELALVASLASDSFAQAHSLFGRPQKMDWPRLDGSASAGRHERKLTVVS